MLRDVFADDGDVQIEAPASLAAAGGQKPEFIFGFYTVESRSTAEILSRSVAECLRTKTGLSAEDVKPLPQHMTRTGWWQIRVNLHIPQERAEDILEALVKAAEEIRQVAGLPYRLVDEDVMAGVKTAIGQDLG